MRTLPTLLLSSCLVLAVYGSPRFTRDICALSTEHYAACNARAYEVYSHAVAAGEDGRPDWMARKSCNFMTTTIEECSNALVGACFSEKEVDDMKDTQVEVFLAQVKKNMPNWDSSKCPAAIAYNERKNPSCEKVNEKLKVAHSLCTAKAFEDYRAAYQAGDDGRPDWMARTYCNYMTAAVENDQGQSNVLSDHLWTREMSKLGSKPQVSPHCEIIIDQDVPTSQLLRGGEVSNFGLELISLSSTTTNRRPARGEEDQWDANMSSEWKVEDLCSVVTDYLERPDQTKSYC